MKLNRLTLGTLLLSAGGCLLGNAQQINPMIEAVLNDYNEMLAENPKDYVTLYDRSSQYYTLGDYNRALSDIDMAIENIPAKETDYLKSAYSLKSDILLAQKDYAGASAAIEKALAITPVSALDLYKAGNIYLLSNKPKEALQVFQRLQRENSRSQEAFYGMAKANVMMGKTDEAVRLISEVENLGKQSFVTYCRIGDLYTDMGRYGDATTNYVIAYTMTDDNSRPLESLKYIAGKEPAAVMQTLNGIIDSKPDNVSLNYIKAILAYDLEMYAQAEKACKDLAAGLEEESPAIYRMMAMSQLAQNNIDEALKSIEAAEKLAPDNIGVITDKAEILLSKNPKEASRLAEQALKAKPDDTHQLMLAANAAILAGDYQTALGHLNGLILSNPSAGEALLIRGYVNSEGLKDGKSGVTDYTRAGNVKSDDSVHGMVVSALGKAKSGKKLDSEGIINEAIQKAGTDRDALYQIAIYYAQTGNLEKAKEFVDKALLNGYGNIYNLKTNPSPIFNLAPIHHLL